jgi:hypothetical protein
MIISYRPLTIDDADQVISIIEQRPEVFMGYTDDYFKNSLISQIPEILKDPYYFNMGFFVDGELTGAGIMKEFVNTPAWCWAYWLVKKATLQRWLNPENLPQFREVMNSMDVALFDEMEKNRKLNRFFFASLMDGSNNKLRTANTIESYERVMQLINRGWCPSRVSRYQFFNDSIVEPYELPKYSYQQDIIGFRSWPIKIRICMAVMKPESLVV